MWSFTFSLFSVEVTVYPVLSLFTASLGVL